MAFIGLFWLAPMPCIRCWRRDCIAKSFCLSVFVYCSLVCDCVNTPVSYCIEERNASPSVCSGFSSWYDVKNWSAKVPRSSGDTVCCQPGGAFCCWFR